MTRIRIDSNCAARCRTTYFVRQENFRFTFAGVHVQGRVPRFPDSVPAHEADLPCGKMGRKHAILWSVPIELKHFMWSVPN
jgi:hypothetical protein